MNVDIMVRNMIHKRACFETHNIMISLQITSGIDVERNKHVLLIPVG